MRTQRLSKSDSCTYITCIVALHQESGLSTLFFVRRSEIEKNSSNFVWFGFMVHLLLEGKYHTKVELCNLPVPYMIDNSHSALQAIFISNVSSLNAKFKCIVTCSFFFYSDINSLICRMPWELIFICKAHVLGSLLIDWNRGARIKHVCYIHTCLLKQKKKILVSFL